MVEGCVCLVMGCELSWQFLNPIIRTWEMIVAGVSVWSGMVGGIVPDPEQVRSFNVEVAGSRSVTTLEFEIHVGHIRNMFGVGNINPGNLL